MPRRDLIIGICLSAVTKSLIQTVIIILLGMLLGVSTFAGQSPLSILISICGIILFIGAFSAAVLCVSLTVAFTTSSPEGYQGITTILSMPVFFASNSLYPVDGLPPVIHEFAILNPLTHLTNGLRFFLIGDHFTALGLVFSYTTGEILLSFLYLLAFALILFWFTLRRINQAIIT
jgi:ABC-2 type transport system permease protein